MDDKQKETRLSLWKQYRAASYRRWRVYSTFLTGLAIGFLFVVILSNSPDNATIFDDYINPGTLVLLFSGILGGVIYTILVDGHVEMPRFVANKGDQFEAGLFGDILLGIAGSVVAYFLLSGTPLFEEGGDNVTIKIAAIGIIGGYGGRAILQFALNRMFSDINVLEEDRQKYLKAAYQQRAEAQEGLKIIDQLNQHIQSELSNSELAELTVAIRQAPASVRKQVFELAKDFRQTASLSDVAKPRIARTIPIFEALTEVEPDNHRYYAQLAYAYKDSGSPDLLKTIQYLDRAIELRGDQHQAETWKYELCRAITRIQQERKNKGTYDFDTAVNDRIIADLLAVARIYNLENILKAAEERNIPVPVWEWMRANKKTLEAREDTRDFVVKLAGPIGDVKPGSSTVTPSEVVNAVEPSYQEWMVAVRDTWLKKLPDQMSLLLEHEKHFCRAGTRYPVESYEIAPNNHFIVKLGHGAGEWYILDTDFENHWDKSWDKTEKSPQDNRHKVSTQSSANSTDEIPQKAIELIKEFEGYHKELPDGRAEAYADAIHGWGVPTIGYGTTRYPDGKKVQKGDIITRQQAEDYLKWEIEEKCKSVLEKIPTWKRMNSNQRGALYSFAYNLGAHFYGGKKFNSITRLCDSPEKWSNENWITEQFIKYRNPGTSAEEGLRRRRIAEANLFCAPVAVGFTEPKESESSPRQSPLQIVYKEKSTISPELIVENRELAKNIQSILIWIGLLEPPADGLFGPLSFDAMSYFQEVMAKKISELASEKGSLGPLTSKALIETSPKLFPKPELLLGNDLPSRIIKYMQSEGYQIFAKKGEFNIVYIEGMNLDGTLNEDIPNHFNDVRMVIEFQQGKPQIVGKWQATTEPGRPYTVRPMNKAGAARIKFGQYKAWKVGQHCGVSSGCHEALSQTGNITVHRDLNKDMKRTGDKLYTGNNFFINQHWGFDNPPDNIAYASAGCLVGRTKAGHKEFMSLIKKDVRYVKNKNYEFYTTIIPGDDLEKRFPSV